MGRNDLPGRIGRRDFARLSMALAWPATARAQDRIRTAALLTGLPLNDELRINRKAADQLGLKLPVALLARADEITA